MNKGDLIDAFKEETGLTKHQAGQVVDLFFGKMTDALARGNRVEIRGLCSLFVKQYKEYTGRNPRTQEEVEVESKKLPFFKCGKQLKERVDY